jgi:hypothetical protein
MRERASAFILLGIAAVRARRELLRRDARPGKCDLDQRAGVDGALDREAGAVGFGQCLGQRQAKSGAAGAPARRGRELAERLHRGFDFGSLRLRQLAIIY